MRQQAGRERQQSHSGRTGKQHEQQRTVPARRVCRAENREQQAQSSFDGNQLKRLRIRLLYKRPFGQKSGDFVLVLRTVAVHLLRLQQGRDLPAQ